MSNPIVYDLAAVGPMVVFNITSQDENFTRWLSKKPYVAENGMWVSSMENPEITTRAVCLIGRRSDKTTCKVFDSSEEAENTVKTVRQAIDDAVKAYSKQYTLEAAKEILDKMPADLRESLLREYPAAVQSEPTPKAFFPALSTYADFSALFAKFASVMPSTHRGTLKVDDSGEVYFVFGLNNRNHLNKERLGTALLVPETDQGSGRQVNLYLCK